MRIHCHQKRSTDHPQTPSYDSLVPELSSVRFKARQFCHEYNTTWPESATFESMAEERMIKLKELLGHVGEEVLIEPPFRVDYGCNISLGDR